MSTAQVNRWNFRDGTVVGVPIQHVMTVSTTSTTYTTTTPFDNTIPTSSEGSEITSLSTAITPKKVGNKIKVTCSIFWAASGISAYIFSLFLNSGASSVCTVSSTLTGSAYTSVTTFSYIHTVTDLTAITFKVRVGPQSAGTFYFNRAVAGDIFGGTATSSMVLEEIQA